RRGDLQRFCAPTTGPERVAEARLAAPAEGTARADPSDPGQSRRFQARRCAQRRGAEERAPCGGVRVASAHSSTVESSEMTWSIRTRAAIVWLLVALIALLVPAASAQTPSDSATDAPADTSPDSQTTTIPVAQPGQP